MWFSQRAGRITASKFKAAARTNISQPSQSLIKLVCYPESMQFRSKATKWGCTHENDALAAYISQEESKHLGFQLSSSGLVLSTDYPHMGSSPDSIVKCECCGQRVVEVKCPFSCRNKSFLEATSEPSFFLQDVNGSLSLNREHAYYYQIQLQMKICGTKCGDFVVWQEKELIVERITIDEVLLAVALESATKFFYLWHSPRDSREVVF